MAFSKPLAMEMEEWGNSFNPRFNRILRIRFQKAFDELKIPNVKVNSEYAIFPISYYETVDSMKVSKTIDFCFIGSVNANKLQKRSREWVHPFVTKNFGEKSYLKFSDMKADYISRGSFDHTNESKCFTPRSIKDNIKAARIDKPYFRILKSSKFCLCPAGDAPWSMRFYEALLCKSIPIVHYKWESWKTAQEYKLDYKYYLTTETEFIYREDWVEHNYKLFMEFHTLNSRNILKYVPESIKKCTHIKCNFTKNTTLANNGGLYCCRMCKTQKGKMHGVLCEKKIWNQPDPVISENSVIPTEPSEISEKISTDQCPKLNTPLPACIEVK